MDFKLKKCVFVCAAGLLAAALPSCSNEDEESGGTISYGKLASEVPLVANAGIQFPVTGIYHQSTNYGNASLAQAYLYRDGRMVGGYESQNRETIEFSSNPLAVKITSSYSSYEETEEFKNIKVNSDGFITSCEWEYWEDYEGEQWWDKTTITLAYDGEGHLILEKYRNTDMDGYWENGTISYTWENGNLVKTEGVSVSSEDEEGDDWRYTEELTYDEDETRYPNTGVWHFYDYQTVGNAGYFYDAFRLVEPDNKHCVTRFRYKFHHPDSGVVCLWHISFALMLVLLVMGKVSGYEGFIAMGVGLAFAYTISMFAEIFTYMYYESKN